MDKIEKQIEELTNYGKEQKGEISEICIKAANTIKQLYDENTFLKLRCTRCEPIRDRRLQRK